MRSILKFIFLTSILLGAQQSSYSQFWKKKRKKKPEVTFIEPIEDSTLKGATIIQKPSLIVKTSMDYKEQLASVEQELINGFFETVQERALRYKLLAKGDNQIGYYCRFAMLEITALSRKFEDSAEYYQWEYWQNELKAANLQSSVFIRIYLAQLASLVHARNARLSEYDGFIADDNSANVGDWSTTKLREQTIDLVNKILADAKQLEVAEIYESVIERLFKSTVKLDVYETVCLTAINFLHATTISTSVTYVGPDKNWIFSPADEFVKTKILVTEDPKNEFRILQLLQDLVLKHPYLDLQRLEFAKKIYELDNQEWIERLKQFYNQYKENEEIGFFIPKLHESGAYSKAEVHKICQEYLNQYRNNLYTASAKNLLDRIERSEISVQAEKIQVLNKKTLALVSASNVSQFFISCYAITEADMKNRNKDYYGYNSLEAKNSIKKFYMNRPAKVQLKKIELPSVTDFENHNIEIALPELQEYGHYVWVIQSTENFEEENCFVKLLYSEVRKNLIVQKEDALQVLDGTTGAVRSGIKVNWYKQIYNRNTEEYEYIRTSTVTTDKAGIVPKPAIIKGYESYKAEVLEDGSSFYKNFYNSNYNYKEKDEMNVDFFTDRQIYRPGQKVYFKGILYLSKSKKTVANSKINITLYNSNGDKVQTVAKTSNALGSVSGEFQLPESSILTGDFRIQSSYGSIYFKVEEYKRPKFSAEIVVPKRDFKLNDRVEIEGLAKAFAGYPIQGAEVKYSVVRNYFVPYFPWWSYRMMPQTNSEQQTIAVGEIKTDENGKFVIPFTALPDVKISESSNPYFTYTIKATVVDINGETHECSYALKLAYTNLQLKISSKQEYLDNEKIEINYAASNLQNNPINFNGKLILKQKKSANQFFRNRIWTAETTTISNSDFANWFPEYELLKNGKNNELVNIDSVEVKNDTSGIWQLNTIKKLVPGEYWIELFAKDALGKTVKTAASFTVIQSSTGKYQGTKGLKIFFPMGNTIEPGNTAKVLIESAIQNATVFVEAKSFRGELLKTSIQLNKEIKQIEIPITEKDRGNIAIVAYTIQNFQVITENANLIVPYSNKELKIKISSIRNETEPGAKEKWLVNLSGPMSEKAAMEMLATLYDKSLDELSAPHVWMRNYFYTFNYNLYIHGNQEQVYSQEVYREKFDYIIANSIELPNVYLINYTNYYQYLFSGSAAWNISDLEEYGKGGAYEQRNYGLAAADSVGITMDAAKEKPEARASGNEINANLNVVGSLNKVRGVQLNTTQSTENVSLTPPPPRTNFVETAFFFPQLKPQANGDIVLEFEMPEALTQWKLKLYAHSTSLQTGYAEALVTTSKKIMVQPNLPRFLREGDNIILGSKIVNTTKFDLEAQVFFELIDEQTGKKMQWLKKDEIQKIRIPANSSIPVFHNLQIPMQTGAVSISITADLGNYADGEKHILPVLSNRMLLTETTPITIRNSGEQKINWSKSGAEKSTTASTHKVAIEMVNSPAWYSVRALPYMMEFPYECAEQLFTRIYANSISNYLMNSNPNVKNIYAQWQASAKNSSTSFASKLQQNQELKTALLQETPWLAAGANETENMQKLARYFSPETIGKELRIATEKLNKLQSEDGGWSWFDGMQGNEWITQTILIGFGKLKNMGINVNAYQEQIESAIYFIDKKVLEEYRRSKKQMGSFGYQFQYLYARSFFMDNASEDKDWKEMFSGLIDSCEKRWNQYSLLERAQLATALTAIRPQSSAISAILRNLNESSITKSDLGMYWPQNKGGYYWNEAPIETQSAIIEAFVKNKQPKEKIDNMVVWLLRQKQTSNWATTRSTADACYAILLHSNFTQNKQNVQLFLNGTEIVPTGKEAGTGYIKEDITQKVENVNSTELSVKAATSDFTYGAVYWQYFENFEKIKPAGSGLGIVKKLYRVEQTAVGLKNTEIKVGDKLKVGDKISVSLTIICDRDLEFIHLKDSRAAGLEPMDVLSGYKYVGGLSYYQSTKDASSNFFIDRISKGTYQINYTLTVQQAGAFSTGAATLQCMYAPEFAAHSAGFVVIAE